jgi:hypothetical protein
LKKCIGGCWLTKTYKISNARADPIERKEENILKGQSIIYFGPEKWDGLWRNRHQLMARFSKFNKVLYVEPRTGLKVTRRKLKNREINLRTFWQNLKNDRYEKVANNLYIYSNPIFFPFSGRPLLNGMSQFLWCTLLKYNISKIGLKKPIIWLSRPQMVNLIGKFNEKLSIYHVVDEYSSYSGVDAIQKAKLKEFEKKILNRTDIVIVVSKNLFLSKKRFNRNTYLVPNAVDYDTYSKALFSTEKSPEDMTKLKKPIIGYSGKIGAKLDLNLVYYMAKLHPNWSLALIGVTDERHCKNKLNRLKNLKNVYFLGFKKVSELPLYVKTFDVCILPYLINEHSKNISPLKLYDYMALGKSIVSTDIPSAHLFKDVIRIGTHKEEFVLEVEKALLEDSNDLFNKRREIASQNTWDKRVYHISQLIQRHLNKNVTEMQFSYLSKE